MAQQSKRSNQAERLKRIIHDWIPKRKASVHETNAVSVNAEACIQRDTYDTAQKIINDDREATEAIEKPLKEMQKEALKSKVKNGVKSGVTGAFIVKNCLEIGLKFGARIATTAASEGGKALMRGLSVAGRLAHVGGFVFSPVRSPVDIYT